MGCLLLEVFYLDGVLIRHTILGVYILGALVILFSSFSCYFSLLGEVFLAQ